MDSLNGHTPTPSPNNVHHGQGTNSRDIRRAVWVQRLAIVMFMFILFGFGVLYYWTLVPDQVLVVHNQPMAVKPNPAAPQSAVFVHFDYCKTFNAVGQVRQSLVSNATEIFAPMYRDSGEKGCKVVDLPVLLPPQAIHDKYRFHFRIVYHPNPIRTITEDFYSQPFEIK